MWVSRKEMDDIVRRLKALEDRKEPEYGAMDHVNFTVYDDSSRFWHFSTTPSKTISVKDAIYNILDHLGLRLTYTAGTPEAVVLAPKPVMTLTTSTKKKTATK